MTNFLSEMSDCDPEEDPTTSMEELLKFTAKELKTKLIEQGLPCSDKEVLGKSLFRHINYCESSDSDTEDSDISYEEVEIRNKKSESRYRHNVQYKRIHAFAGKGQGENQACLHTKLAGNEYSNHARFHIYFLWYVWG